jgi:hypothetical protein
MSTLRELQHAFATGLLSGDAAAVAPAIIEDGIAGADRLCIYRNSARTTLTEALRLTYPCIARLVGSDFFEMGAARFIGACPPRSGCLTDYGDGFADFLAALPEAAGVPYLADVARFEWALAKAAAAEDAPHLDVFGVVKVDGQDHELLRFEPHPSVSLLRLHYPADEIADSVAARSDDAMHAIDLRAGPVWIVVHRGSDGVQAERVTQAAHGFLQRLFAGEPLGAVLENTDPEACLVFADQFAKGRLSAMRVEPVGPRCTGAGDGSR